MVGGESLTEQTAEQVKPALPARPSVVTTDTAVARPDMAARKSGAVTGSTRVSQVWTGGANTTPSVAERVVMLASLRPLAALYYAAMDMISIPSSYSADLDLHHLQVLDVLL